MDIGRFWQIIDGARARAKGDQGAMLEEMSRALEALAPPDIASYQEHFDALVRGAYRWDLWGAAYIMNGGCSDDGFEYFRYWLIAMGRGVHENAMRDPDSLAGVAAALDEEGFEFESFGYVAQQVYEEKAGKEMPRATVKHPAEPAGERWEEDGDDLARRFPKLWKKYAE